MDVVKAGLAALVLALGCVAAADCALAQAPQPGANPQAPMARPMRKGLHAQAPMAPSPQAPAAAPAAPSAPAPVAKTNARGPDQEYKECLNLWDAATHMTRAEWAATCRRIQTRLNDITTQARDVSLPNRRRAR